MFYIVLKFYSLVKRTHAECSEEKTLYLLVTLFSRYYIEILLQEYRLSAFVDVGLYQYGNVYTEQQTEDAVNEEQVIQSQSAIVQEVQVCYDYSSTV